jgi:Protein of unknown function DUF262
VKSSQFEAKTFGVGELIMQRKLFVVPPHQRSFAWGKEAGDEFLADVETAWKNGSTDYFIGLIVIQGSADGEWILLDGQQRLTTVSLIFSSIRYWLHVSGFAEDAKQINHEYLGVRRLGGEYSTRMLLNVENRSAFESATALIPDKDLQQAALASSKKSSNRLILDLAVSSRAWVDAIAGERSIHNEDGAKLLYLLARFLDTKLKVVAVEVSSEVDAYVLFESLNDRGVALSALDLIKNYIFSRDPTGQETWDGFLSALGDADPEEFLKIFWTSRFGNIQKSQIFRWVKDKYPSADEAKLLLSQMREDAELLAAIYDDDHPYWTKLPDGLRSQVFLLRFLESKQARPVVMAILRSTRDTEIAQEMVSILATAIMRFQVVGKGRTGVVEKIVGRLCVGLHSGTISDPHSFRDTVSELMTPDSEFSNQFLGYADARYSRLGYILAEYQVFKRLAREDEVGFLRWRISPEKRVALVRHAIESSRLVRIFDSDSSYSSADGSDVLSLIGNYRLESKESVEKDFVEWNLDQHGTISQFVINRTTDVGNLACVIWSSGDGSAT